MSLRDLKDYENDPVGVMRRMREMAPWMFAIGVIVLVIMVYTIYSQFRIDVPTKHFAVLIKKTGLDITNEMECAPDKEHKGVQRELLMEGSLFLQPMGMGLGSLSL